MYIFRHIMIFINQEIWKQFVQKLPNEFNEILKSSVKKHANKLVTYYKMQTSATAGDFEKDPKNALSRDFEALYSNMAFSDVDLEVEGKTLRAHKLILMSK
jgi:hypothetical protein